MIWDSRLIQGEMWLAGKLGIDDLYGGVTTVEKRRERLREEILVRGIANDRAGRTASGESETYARAFERLYRQPL